MGQETKETRLHKVAKELNVGVSTIVDFLNKKGFQVDSNPNQRINSKQYDILVKEFSSDITIKKQMEKLAEIEKEKKKAISAENKAKRQAEKQNNGKNNDNSNQVTKENGVKVLGKIDLDQNKNKNDKSGNSSEAQNNKNNNNDNQKQNKQNGSQPKEQNSEQSFKVLGKIDLDSINTKMRPDKKSKQEKRQEREQRQREQQRQNQQNQQKRNDAANRQQQPQPQPKKVETNSVVDSVKKQETENKEVSEEIFRPNSTVLSGPKILGKIDIDKLIDNDSNNAQQDNKHGRRRARRRGNKVDINGEVSQNRNDKSNNKKQPKKENNNNENNSNENKKGGKNNDRQEKNIKSDRDKKDGGKGGKRQKDKDRWKAPEITEDDIKKQIKEVNATMQSSKGKTFSSKRAREKREDARHKEEIRQQEVEKENKILKVTQFITADELATMMNVPVTQIIATCFDLGTIISINQRLDAEIIQIVASEFGFEVKFIGAEEEEEEELQNEDNPEDMQPRPPIVTIMGHVDHGKTSLLDYIRNTNVIAGEAGGITQHIGAYNVKLADGKHITFLDTPGHAAFTAMRARGAKITDIVVIVIAADDSIMPQTEEAISHALAAEVPIIFAINKIDKPAANPQKIKEELANKNLLVEEWGGKYGSVEISAKKGLNVDKLLERILLEAEMLELKANYKRPAFGTVIEASLDKGRGYTSNIIVEGGILKIGDAVCAGRCSGKIRAMFNERGKKITEAKPSEPAVILGLDGAPVAGDKFKVMPDERTAREKATRRELLDREMAQRTQRHMTLDLISKRIALGIDNFKELKLIIKGDVQGSIEALADSLEKLSTEEIEVKVIQKAVGQISENDVMLASASDAIIIGFQVRPSSGAKRLAEKEQISIELYSVIYDAIEDVKNAMEKMLSPEIKEEITGTAEVQQTFKISKVGTIAGCVVKEGKILKSNKCRVIRDGIVIHDGTLESLKHFKDDVKEVGPGMECGLNVAKFNDIQEGDIIESYEEKKVSRKLD
ncbi:MAG: translation initiation factor IF-2 [Bacteroidales bacterium]|nr:translation initiation factor IF-2 [Bacteroidales bacterium]